CNGMVRSGSTLQYNRARVVVEQLGVGCGRAGLQAAVRRGAVPAYDDGSLASTDFATDAWTYVSHSHYLDAGFVDVQDAAEAGRRGGLKVLYVHRDLRDVVASMKRAWSMDWAACCDILDRVEENYDFTRRHLHTDWVFVQRYEGLVRNLPRAVDGITVALGIELPRGMSARVARECSVARAEEVTRGLRTQMVENRDALFGADSLIRERMAGLVTNMHYNHISPTRGASGVWRAQLTSDEVEQATRRCGQWMAELGY
ncbi:MAG: hypothetical protein ABGY41_21410, partial [Candidatus Poribacteria bacterium]